MAVYGYARVSTMNQDLSVQLGELKEANVDSKNIFKEKYTGTSTDRPQFNRLMSALSEGDELVITKLDRLARNTREALEVIETLLEKNISITVLNLGKIENTSIGRMIYTILLSVAELERDMIVERTQAGKEYARKHNPNFKDGRPKRVLTQQHLHAIELLQTNTYKVVEAKTGLSKSTLQRIKRQYKAEQETK